MNNTTNALSIATQRAHVYNKTGNKYHNFNSDRIATLVRSTILDLGMKLDSDKIGLKKPSKNAKSTQHRMEFRIDIGDAEIKPQIIIDNSFNGEGSLVFRYGIYRMVCSNGLMVGTDIGTPIRVRHMKGQKADAFESQFVEHCKHALNQLIQAVTTMRSGLQSVPVVRERVYAHRQLFLDHLVNNKIISDKQRVISLTARIRNSDADGTAWGLFNAVQESIVTRRNGSRNESGAAIDRNDKLHDVFLRYIEQGNLAA